MIRSILATVFLLSNPSYADEIVEIDIHGLTCAFCVDAVQRNLLELPDEKKAQVSLKTKKVRVYGTDAGMDRDRLRQTIIDSGFTPVAIREMENDE